MCAWMMDTDSLIRSLCSAKLLLKAEAELSDFAARLPSACRAGAKAFLWSWNEVTLEDGARVPVPCGISAAVFSKLRLLVS